MNFIVHIVVKNLEMSQQN